MLTLKLNVTCFRLDYRPIWEKDFRAYLKKLDENKPVILSR